MHIELFYECYLKGFVIICAVTYSAIRSVLLYRQKHSDQNRTLDCTHIHQ